MWSTLGFERDARKAYHARLLSLPIPYARRSSGSRRKRRSNTTIETGHPAALYEDETTHNVLSKAKEEEEKSHGHENWHGGFIVIPKKSVLFLIFYSVLPYCFSDFFSLSQRGVYCSQSLFSFTEPRRFGTGWYFVFILFMSTFPLCSSPWESIPRASFLLIWKGACHIRVRIHGIDSKLMFRVHLPASKS